MIYENEGRSRSVRTQAELERMIEKELATLSPEEREVVELALKELKEPDPADITAPPPDNAPKILEAIGAADYRWNPVDMHTFVHDPFYLGNTCDNLYPKLEEDLAELFEGTYHEAVFTGSIGYGKTFAASIGICRVLYELSCMKDPHSTFGIAKGSNIAIVALSVTEQLAIKVVFENIAMKIKSSPYFQKHFPFEDTKKELRFPNNIWLAARATTDTSALGLNTISAILDETNFMPRTAKEIATGAPDRAELLYAQIQRRMKSRFERQGQLPGKLFIVSSKKTLDDFTAKRVRESKNDPTVFVRDYAMWDVKPDNYYASKKFHVLVGNEQIPSAILSEKEYLDRVESVPEDVRIITVPEDFRTDFERDLEGAIRDLAGVATVAINPYISRREKIQEAVDIHRRHPYTTLVLDPSKPGRMMWEMITTQVRERNPYTGNIEMVYRPLINPKIPRHIHIDPSLRGDATGFTVAHIGGWKDVIRRGEDGREYQESAPIYVVDFTLRIVPPLGDEIVLGDIRSLVYDFVQHGFSVTTVTLDSWQSADTLQQLKQKGFDTYVNSVDVTMEPYDNLKMALYENRVSIYDYAPLLDELRTLEKHTNGRRTKVDHPRSGSKDVSDSLAGVCFSLSKKATRGPLPSMRGREYGEENWMQEQRQIVPGTSKAQWDQPVTPFLIGPRGGGFDGSGEGWM